MWEILLNDPMSKMLLVIKDNTLFIALANVMGTLLFDIGKFISGHLVDLITKR